MKRGRQVASVALVVLFAFFAYESLQLSLSDAIGPGAGFFPFWLSVLGSILGAILLVQLKLGHAELTGEFTFEREGTHNVVLMLAGLIVAAVCSRCWASVSPCCCWSSTSSFSRSMRRTGLRDRDHGARRQLRRLSPFLRSPPGAATGRHPGRLWAALAFGSGLVADEQRGNPMASLRNFLPFLRVGQTSPTRG
jgi:hypothetical protein